MYLFFFHRGGNWKTGGTCHLETLPELGSSLVPSETWSQLKTVVDVLSARTNRSEVLKLDLLNVTDMSSRRKDGHSSRYYLPDPAPLHRQDCSHWCLPGVPDAWNELLYALFLKHAPSNSSAHAQSWLVKKYSLFFFFYLYAGIERMQLLQNNSIFSTKKKAEISEKRILPESCAVAIRQPEFHPDVKTVNSEGTQT